MLDLIDIPFGTRFVGYYSKSYGNQIPVSSRKEIKQIVEEHLGLDNLAISISTYKDRKPYLLFLPFDFDSDNLRSAWDDAKRLYNYLVRHDYSAYIIFSGRKGFHVLLLTEPKVYTKKQLKIVQNHFKKLLALSTVDTQIFGDRRRLMRIPQTYNIYGGLCKVLAESEGNRLDLDIFYEDIDKPIKNKPRKKSEISPYQDYPCIEFIIRNDSEPRHLIRFTYVILRLADGWSYDEIVDEISTFGWQDFNPDYTYKQIEHIDGRGYVPLSCNSLRDLGYCNVQDCIHSKDIKTNLKEVGIE